MYDIVHTAEQFFIRVVKIENGPRKREKVKECKRDRNKMQNISKVEKLGFSYTIPSK